MKYHYMPFYARVSGKLQKRLREIRINEPYINDIIDLLRIRYNVIIYHSAPPFVSPINNKIVYAFAVKVCYPKMGWNQRQFIGRSEWRSNMYQAQREAINIAVKWILSHKSQEKAKIISLKKK